MHLPGDVVASPVIPFTACALLSNSTLVASSSSPFVLHSIRFILYIFRASFFK